MTTELEERIGRVLDARARAVTVVCPPLDEVLDGDTAPRRRSRSLVAIAACLLAIALVGGGVVVATSDAFDERGPAEVASSLPSSTTAAPMPLPGVEVGHLPEGFERDRASIDIGRDGLTWSLEAEGPPPTYGSGEVGPEPRRLAVAVMRTVRSARLAGVQADPGATDTTALVEAYIAGGSRPVAPAAPEPTWASNLPDPAVGRDTEVLVVAGEAVLVVARERSAPVSDARGDPVRLIAIRDGLEIHVTGEWLRLGELTSVLAGLDGVGSALIVASGRPELGEDVPAGTSMRTFAMTALPDGWVPTMSDDLTGVTGGAELLVRYQPAGASRGAMLPVPPWINASVGAAPIPTEVAAALEAGDTDALLAASDHPDPSFYDEVERWVVWDGGRPIVLEGVRVDTDGGTPEVDGRQVLQATTWLGPDLTLTVQSEGVTEAVLVAAVASASLLP